MATIIDWDLDLASNRSLIRTEGMFSAINDCVARSVNRFQLLAVVDFDEFLAIHNSTDTKVFDFLHR